MGARFFRPICAACVVSLAVASVAHAADPITISWQAPEGCPDASAVRSDVDRLLGGASKEGRAPLDVVGRIEGKSRALRLVLQMKGTGTETTRKLDATSCSTLSEAGALLVALAFDPEAVAAASAAEESPKPPATTTTPTPIPTTTTTPTTTPTPIPTATTTPTATRTPTATTTPIPTATTAPIDSRRPRRWEASRERKPYAFGFGVGFLGDGGSLPALAPGFRIGAVVVLRAYELHAAFEGWPRSDATLPDRSTQGAKLSLFAGQIRGCRLVLPWRPVVSPVTLSGCLDIEAGRMSGAGFGVTSPSRGGAFWIAPGTSFDLRLDLPRPLGFIASAGLAVPLDRRSFVIQTPDRDVVHTPAPVSGRFGLAADVRF